jgi:hypothetical protein
MAKCSAIKADNGRCKVEAMPGAEWCWNHLPDYAEARRRRASRGGKRGGRGRPQAELANIKDRLQELAEDVLEEEVEKGVAAVASQVLNVYLRAVSMEMKLREVEELERRMDEIEAMIAARKERPPWGA